MRWSVGAAQSILGCSMDITEVWGERRALSLSSLRKKASLPLHETLAALDSSFSDRMLHIQSSKEQRCTSFPPAAVRLFKHYCSLNPPEICTLFVCVLICNKNSHTVAFMFLMCKTHANEICKYIKHSNYSSSFWTTNVFLGYRQENE